MFNFKKKILIKGDKELSPQQVSFLQALAEKLSNLYPAFKKQLEIGVITAISINPLGRKGSFSFTLDSEKWDSLCDKAKVSFRILGLSAKGKDGNNIKIEISTNEGLMIGLYSSKDIESIDVLTIDASLVYEKHFVDPDLREVVNILELLKPYAGKLDLSTSNKLSVKGYDFFTIKDLGDGNYLGVDKDGVVYNLCHDPFEVKRIHNSIKEFIENSSVLH